MSTKIGKDKKVLVLDLDGTLTNSQKEITDRTLDAIMKMQEQGHKDCDCDGQTYAGGGTCCEET